MMATSSIKNILKKKTHKKTTQQQTLYPRGLSHKEKIRRYKRDQLPLHKQMDGISIPLVIGKIKTRYYYTYSGTAIRQNKLTSTEGHAEQQNSHTLVVGM